MKFKSGFTLIELLVVVSIISSMSSIVFAAVNDARYRALETKVAQDMRTIQTALELYYNDHNDYPSWTGRTGVDSVTSSWNLLGTALSPYLSKIPTPDYPSVISGGQVMTGYVYYKGAPRKGVRIRILDSQQGYAFASCVVVYDGYYLTALLPKGQTKFTKNDGGADPDAIDQVRNPSGRVDITKNSTDCPSSTIVQFDY